MTNATLNFFLRFRKRRRSIVPSVFLPYDLTRLHAVDKDFTNLSLSVCRVLE
jgi:hypothetical protein